MESTATREEEILTVRLRGEATPGKGVYCENRKSNPVEARRTGPSTPRRSAAMGRNYFSNYFSNRLRRTFG